MRNNERLQNFLAAENFQTFNVLEHRLDAPVGAFDSGPQKPTGTDKDEYERWMESLGGGQGIGEIIIDDPDDARDLAEFDALSANAGATEEHIRE